VSVIDHLCRRIILPALIALTLDATIRDGQHTPYTHATPITNTEIAITSAGH